MIEFDENEVLDEVCTDGRKDRDLARAVASWVRDKLNGAAQKLQQELLAVRSEMEEVELKLDRATVELEERIENERCLRSQVKRLTKGQQMMALGAEAIEEEKIAERLKGQALANAVRLYRDDPDYSKEQLFKALITYENKK